MRLTKAQQEAARIDPGYIEALKKQQALIDAERRRNETGPLGTGRSKAVRTGTGNFAVREDGEAKDSADDFESKREWLESFLKAIYKHRGKRLQWSPIAICRLFNEKEKTRRDELLRFWAGIYGERAPNVYLVTQALHVAAAKRIEFTWRQQRFRFVRDASWGAYFFISCLGETFVEALWPKIGDRRMTFDELLEFVIDEELTELGKYDEEGRYLISRAQFREFLWREVAGRKTRDGWRFERANDRRWGFVHFAPEEVRRPTSYVLKSADRDRIKARIERRNREGGDE